MRLILSVLKSESHVIDLQLSAFVSLINLYLFDQIHYYWLPMISNIYLHEMITYNYFKNRNYNIVN